MTPGLAGLRNNLAGAWALMLGRPEGLDLFDLSLDGFWRSFGAIFLIAPFAMLALLSQRLLMAANGDPPAPLTGGGLSLQMVALLADWLIFPLLFAALARPLGLGARYVPFIVARNWASVIVAAMVAGAHALHVLGVLSSEIAPLVMFVAVALALRISYVIARTALAVSMGMALPIVVLDFLISLTVWSAVDRLLA